MTYQSEDQKTLMALLLVMAAGYLLLGDLLGGTLFIHDPYDSYTLQTWNWLHGRMYIESGDTYDWLELAVFNGRYYLSFPPVPSVVLLPFVLIWGLDTPNNALACLYGLTCAALAYRIMRRRDRSPRTAAFWALFTVWGSNMLWMTINSGVWFQAQALCMAFCLGAVLAAMNGRRALSTTLLALAVGCRPLSAVFLPVLVLRFAWEDRKENGCFAALARQWPCVIGPLIVGAGLMAYNAARFGSPLEFGHNYLPEFVRAELGQFHISYLLPNLKRLLFSPVTLTDGRLSFSRFNGFLFYAANPLYLVLFGNQIIHVMRRDVGWEGLLIAGGIVLELLLLCMHRTLGGLQFGARYTCDMLPFALWYLADRGETCPAAWELCLGGLAVAFNAYGVIYMGPFF